MYPEHKLYGSELQKNWFNHTEGCDTHNMVECHHQYSDRKNRENDSKRNLPNTIAKFKNVTK